MMKKIIECEIEESKYEKFENIIKRKNISVGQILTILIDKSITSDSIDWLYSGLNGEVKSKNTKKKNAIILFRQKGHKIFDYYTNFATKNTDNDVYWINPDKRHLKEDWYIILDDNIGKRLYLLFIPKDSIKELKMKNNKECNVAIRYNDLNFLDLHSGVSFKNYLVDFIDYESLIN